MINFYSRLAKYYDKMYESFDYEKNVADLHMIIQKYKKSSGNRLLDVACGTGTHISYLKHMYNALGFDISADMLEIARGKCSDVEFIQGNMISMMLDREFDVIICLFGSIGYLTDRKDLEQAIHAFSNHIVTGGLLVIEPMFTSETYRDRSTGILCLDLPEIKIARANVTRRDGDIAYLDFHFLISTKEKGTEYFIDPSPMSIFSKGTYLQLMEKNSFSASFIEPGLSKEGLFIGVKI